MSPLKEEMRKNPHTIHRAFRNLEEMIDSLYRRVKARFDEYDGKLLNKENKYVERGKDFFSKIIWRDYNDKKNKFIGGV
jgi:hypothetical protein